MHDTIQILLVPVTVLGSVLLVCSCLFFKRSRMKNRNASSSVPGKNKPGKTTETDSKVHGITNTAFTVGNGGANIYENEVNVYDYAKNERSKETKRERQSKSNARGQDTMSEISPTYDDVTDDTDTRFYFTLERPAKTTGVTERDTGTSGDTETNEDTYVIVIPDNIYDKPEETEKGASAETTNVQGAASKFYYTLEEYSEQKDQMSSDMGPEESLHSGGAIYDTPDGDSGIQDEISIKMEENDQIQSGDEDTYVINIPIGYVVKIPNDMNDSQKVPRNNQGEGYSRQMGTQFDKTDRFSRNIAIEKDIKEFGKNKGTEDDDKENRYSGQLGKEGDKGEKYSENKREEKGTNDHEEIYENVNKSFSRNNQEQLSHGISVTESCAKKAEKLEINADTLHKNSHKNTGYLNDDMLTQNKTKKSLKSNKIDEENDVDSSSDDDDDDDYVIPASDENMEGLPDEGIYENWEHNIIGRAKSVSGESGDEIYLNETNDIMKERNQDSGSLYQNLTEFRHSLVLQDTR